MLQDIVLFEGNGAKYGSFSPSGSQDVFASGSRPLLARRNGAFWEFLDALGQDWEMKSVRFSPNKYRVGDVQRANHFGLISFDWNSDIPRARLEIRDLKGEAVNGVDFSMKP